MIDLANAQTLTTAALIAFALGVAYTLGKAAAASALRRLSRKLLGNSTASDDFAGDVARIVADVIDRLPEQLPPGVSKRIGDEVAKRLPK